MIQIKKIAMKAVINYEGGCCSWACKRAKRAANTIHPHNIYSWPGALYGERFYIFISIHYVCVCVFVYI